MAKIQQHPTDTRLLRRLAPPLAFVAALCVLVICCYDSGYTSLPPTEKRYSAAKADIASLKANTKRASQREPWEKLAQEFRDIYEQDPAWPNRPAALFRAAESLEELARRSFVKADARKAVACYENLALRHADSRLADDALFRAARLRASWLRDDAGALELLRRARKQYPRGDMRAKIDALEKALRASASGRTAPEAMQVAAAEQPVQEDAPVRPQNDSTDPRGIMPRYIAAKKRMENLTADKTRSCWRQPWEELRDEFLTLSKAGKGWAIAPGALFRAAASQESLARCSHQGSDYRKALQLYHSLTMTFPKSALADDAMLQAARINAHLKEKDKALALVQDLYKRYPNGDMRPAAEALAASLQAQAQPAAPAGKQAVEQSQAKTPAHKSELQVLSWDSPNRDSVEIVLEMSGPVQYSSRLVRKEKKGQDTPDRLYLDLADSSVVSDVRKGVSISGSLLQAVRVRDRKDGGATLQFDFRDVGRYDIRKEDDPCRIVLSVAAGKVPLPQRQNAAVAEALPDTPDAPPPSSRKVTAPGQMANMANQLGLSVHTVFIDAGHGGRDPGATHNDVLERNITLDVAMTLGRLLRANGLEVVYSRKRDQAIALSERTHMANKERADLFVSIHVNASPDPSVHGVETYYLDLARNPQAARVAALENAGSDRRLGDMQDMLADVMLSARVGESRRLAGDIQRLTMFRLKRRNYEVRNNGVKSAPFHVLIGAQMPAVLVELGYCSNKAEAKKLLDPKYRLALAEGLAEGILAYRDRLQDNSTAQNTLTNKKPDAM
ncbi:MAG: N-acetylmuramoyl-L-alanine amidase [Desulfovibrio sp.]|nr:N-acetylmuramoyl-L-alanine amidase [Desulfovibrio sp.]